MRYRAVVENNRRQLPPPSGCQHLWSDLPGEVLPFLLPSRFCPSDKFIRFAQRQFGGAGDGVARIMAILEWLYRHVDYVVGVSNAETTAERTFVDRAGVCRDFTHLGITLTRALGIPARAVSAFALQLDPSDFHAIFEVYLENDWWLIDPTPVGSNRRHCTHRKRPRSLRYRVSYLRQAMSNGRPDNSVTKAPLDVGARNPPRTRPVLVGLLSNQGRTRGGRERGT